jgi:ABC-type branched-subunit amino acid transport system substrate-binding protein
MARLSFALRLAVLGAFALAACRPPLRVPPNEATPVPTPYNPVVRWRVAAGEPGSPSALEVFNAVQLALDEGTLSGSLCAGKVKIELVPESMPVDSSAPGALGRVREAALGLSADAQAWLFITTADSAALRVILPVAGVAGEDPIPVFGLSAGAIGLTQPGNASEPDVYSPIGRPNFARLAADDGARAARFAEWAAGKGIRNATVVFDPQRPEVGDAIATRLKPLSVAARHALDAPETLARALVTARPELIYYAGENGPVAGALLKALKAAGYTGRFAGGAALLSAGFLAAAGSAAEGALTTDGPVPGTTEGFGAAYQRRFQVAPSALAGRAWDAAKAALAATAKICATPERDAFRKAFMSTRDFAGASGARSLSANGDAQPMPLVVVARSGNAWVPAP